MAMESPSGGPLLSSPFPRSINRRLGLAFLVFLSIILATGGLSSFLARSILSIARQIPVQSHHIEITDDIHATILRLMHEVNRAVIQGNPGPHSHLDRLNARAAAMIAAYLESHLTKEEPFPEKEKEIALIQALQALHADLGRAAARIVAHLSAKTRGTPEDLKVLDAVAHQLPELTHQLNEIHHAKIRRLVTGGVGRMKSILGSYVIFLAVGGVCVMVGTLLFSRTVAMPLRRLVSATLDIAAGNFEKRVPVGSRDEIGQLSQAFNDMAEKLERREAELCMAQAELGRRVSETRALYDIGVEISSMLELDKVLHSVVEKARTLLQGEGAALCLFRSDGSDLEVRAASGTLDACGVRIKAGQPPFLVEAGGCLGPCSPSCSTCMTVEGGPPALYFTAPLRRGKEVLGVLCVGRGRARVLQAEDQQLLDALAAQAAIAIENARLYRDIKSLATTQERGRIAREIHDGFAQAVGFLHLRLKTLEDRLQNGSHPPTLAELTDIRVVAKRAYEDVRQSIFGLRTVVPKGLGLIPTLGEYLREFSQQSGIVMELQDGDARVTRFSPEAEVQLIRVIQEALTNVRKHAGARHAWVTFAFDGDTGRVIIADDGIGFHAESLSGDNARRFGLRIMRERAEGLGGSLEIRSTHGQGTQVVATIPLMKQGCAL
jgi:nitrate/nitrite-specific signal transduction histidine kinase